MSAAGEPTEAVLLRRRIAALESERLELLRQRDELARVKAEISLGDFARGLGRAATVAEAAAPDRAVRSLSATVRGHFTPEPGGVGIRFQPPELGGRPDALGSASLQLAKVPPAPDAPAPSNLGAVLQEKQLLYADERWPRKAEGRRVVAEIIRVLGLLPGAPELVETASSIAAHERRMALSFRGGEGQPYRTSTRALIWLVNAVTAKADASAGDLLALGAALAATTATARELLR
ncbi:MAG TPA: hypothetical protein VLK24_04560 [Gaiellaceae bacterium]|nr:hypothetical protein [Gaiellaceae bacterium]